MESPATSSRFLDRTIRVEWLLGLLLALAVYYHRSASEDAQSAAQARTALEQRPDLIDRRNREMDALRMCMERQLDLALRCNGR